MGTIDRFDVEFTLPQFRKILNLPKRRDFPSKSNYDDMVPEDALCNEIIQLGYSGPLNKASEFKRTNLRVHWHTLFTILNRCLTEKAMGTDLASISVLRMFHAVAYNRH